MSTGGLIFAIRDGQILVQLTPANHSFCPTFSSFGRWKGRSDFNQSGTTKMGWISPSWTAASAAAAAAAAGAPKGEGDGIVVRGRGVQRGFSLSLYPSGHPLFSIVPFSRLTPWNDPHSLIWTDYLTSWRNHKSLRPALLSRFCYR